MKLNGTYFEQLEGAKYVQNFKSPASKSILWKIYVQSIRPLCAFLNIHKDMTRSRPYLHTKYEENLANPATSFTVRRPGDGCTKELATCSAIKWNLFWLIDWFHGWATWRWMYKRAGYMLCNKMEPVLIDWLISRLGDLAMDVQKSWLHALQ